MPSNLNTTFDWPTNFSNGTSITGIGGLFEYANYVTDGMFALGMLTLIFLMTFAVGMMMGTKRALTSSSFITFIFSVYFWRMSLITPVIPIVLLIVAIIGAIGSKAEGGI